MLQRGAECRAAKRLCPNIDCTKKLKPAVKGAHRWSSTTRRMDMILPGEHEQHRSPDSSTEVQEELMTKENNPGEGAACRNIAMYDTGAHPSSYMEVYDI